MITKINCERCNGTGLNDGRYWDNKLQAIMVPLDYKKTPCKNCEGKGWLFNETVFTTYGTKKWEIEKEWGQFFSGGDEDIIIRIKDGSFCIESHIDGFTYFDKETAIRLGEHILKIAKKYC